MKYSNKKAFSLWSAVFLGIGSMVGAGIFIVIGEAGDIAGNLVTVSFLLGAVIALFSGYSLAKLAVAYPSRGGIIEYLVQEYEEGYFSGTLGILFYFSQLISIAAVAKSFGTYASTYLSQTHSEFYINAFALGILAFFVIINLLGASAVAKMENIIVIIKISALVIFTSAALFFINPAYLKPSEAPPIINIFYALGLTFFAYQGFSVITNSVEDMPNPKKTILKAMTFSIVIVAVLYIAITIAVFGNLTLEEIKNTKDFALAEAAKPAFGIIGFKIVAATALLATASAINASLYSVTQISYTLAKEGDLPIEYEYNIFHNTEGLIISAILIIPIILYLNLAQIATTAAISVLLIQGFTHLGHITKRKETDTKLIILIITTFLTFGASYFAIKYTATKMPQLKYYLIWAFIISFLIEYFLRLLYRNKINKQS